jgi:hypothetical protein
VRVYGGKSCIKRKGQIIGQPKASSETFLWVCSHTRLPLPQAHLTSSAKTHRTFLNTPSGHEAKHEHE